jgi:hypothetical protein
MITPWSKFDELEPRARALGLTDEAVRHLSGCGPDEATRQIEAYIAQHEARSAVALLPEPVAAVAAPVVVAEKPAKKNRRGVVARGVAARAGSRTRRRWRGKLNREVYRHYFPVPLTSGERGQARTKAESRIDDLFEAMPDPCLRRFVYICRKADRDGVADLSTRVARSLSGKAADGGDRYLRLLCESRLIERVASGGADVGRLASEYRISPYSPALIEHAIRVFTEYRNARGEEVRNRRKAGHLE